MARSVSPQRIRPTQASHAVSSIAVISVNICSERAGAVGSMPTALPKSAANWSVMVTCVPRREDLRTGGTGILRRRQVEVSGQEVARRDVVVALLAHALEHEWSYCAALASWVASPAMTTISSARSVSVIVVTFCDRSICWTRPSMKVETVTVPGGFVTVNVGPTGSSSTRPRRRTSYASKASRSDTSEARSGA